MITHYDRSGVPISLDEWVQLYEANDGYKRVARTTITDAASPATAWDVSTVWLGIDHDFTRMGPPLIFETMVFGEGSEDIDCHRYPTEALARQGHADTVTVVAATLVDPVIMDAE